MLSAPRTRHLQQHFQAILREGGIIREQSTIRVPIQVGSWKRWGNLAEVPRSRKCPGNCLLRLRCRSRPFWALIPPFDSSRRQKKGRFLTAAAISPRMAFFVRCGVYEAVQLTTCRICPCFYEHRICVGFDGRSGHTATARCPDGRGLPPFAGNGERPHVTRRAVLFSEHPDSREPQECSRGDLAGLGWQSRKVGRSLGNCGRIIG